MKLYEERQPSTNNHVDERNYSVPLIPRVGIIELVQFHEGECIGTSILMVGGLVADTHRLFSSLLAASVSAELVIFYRTHKRKVNYMFHRFPFSFRASRAGALEINDEPDRCARRYKNTVRGTSFVTSGKRNLDVCWTIISCRGGST